MECNGERFNQFFHKMLELSVYLAPASYEAAFMSAAHTDKDLDDTIEKARTAISLLS